MMFYSQCLLDKKGPLRTVWIAAHLDRKLKKNQVTKISITAAVDTILYSRVPIALRLSGYLLFGVVRIYSKKVNYLYQDCGETLLRIKRAFHSAHVDLPSDANMAPFHAVTLPETSEFEYIELDDLGYENTRGLESHVSTHDQITLHERPQEFEARVWFRADDHVCGTKDNGDMFNLYESNRGQKHSLNMEYSHHEITSLEEDVLPPLPLDGSFGFGNMDFETSDSLDSIGDAAPSSPNVSSRSVSSCELTVGEIQNIIEEPTEPTNIAECEILCAEQHFPSSGDTFVGTNEPHTGEESIEIDGLGKGWRTVTNIDLIEEIPLPERGVSGTKMGPPSPPSTPKSISRNDNVLASILGCVSPDVMSTPKTPAAQERRPISSKRKQILDESIFLSNEFMSQDLTSTDSICRILKKVPCTSIEVRKSYRLSHMEQLFLEPSVPGMSNELHKLYKRVFTSQKRKCSVYNHEEKCSFEDTQKNARMKDFHMPEMKKTCNAHEPMPCETQTIPYKMDRHNEHQMMGCEEQGLEAQVAGLLPSEHVSEAGAAELSVSDMMIRSPSLEVDHSGLSGEFHHVEVPTSDTEHGRGLSFLEEDSRCEDSVVRDSEKAHLHFDTNDLPTRTRSVAKYLKRSLGNLISDQQESKLSLDGILSGRTRKEACRMFFEILTLKSKDYICVEQKASYSSILVSGNSKLLMAIF